MSILSVNVGTLKFDKPCIVASGIMDETGDSMVRMLNSGAGAVVSKSVGTNPNAGHPNPNFTEVSCGCVNAMGLPNPGIEAFREEMEVAVKAGPIIGSIYGASAKEFSELAGKMEDYGACAIELNLSCPHAKGYGIELGTDPEMVKNIVSAVKESVSVPVWTKLTPNTHILPAIGKAVEDAGGDAIVAINTLKAMVIVPEFAKPLLSNKTCGLSGKCIKPIGVRAEWDLYKSVSIPIVGVGGITDYRDALEYIMAGASAVQLGSAVLTHGTDIFNTINSDLERFMTEYGYASIKDMVGVANE